MSVAGSTNSNINTHFISEMLLKKKRPKLKVKAIHLHG